MAESTNQQLPQLSNTFTEGMNTDVADAMLKSTLYRDAMNLHLTTSENGNGYTLHTIDGTSNPIVFVSNAIIVTISGDIVSLCTIRNWNVLITVNNYNNWFVYKYDTLSNIGTNLSPKYNLIQVFSCTTGTNLYKYDDNLYHISTVTKWEDDDNIKVYVADGGNPIRIINIANTYTITTDDSMMLYPSATFLPIQLTLITNGRLKAGMILYCYLLYNKYGTESEISPLTQLYSLASDTTAAKASSITGQYLDTSTGIGMLLSINITADIASKFDHISIISILYTLNGLLPTISLLSQRTILEGTYYYTNYDNTAIDTYTVDTFNALTGIKFVPLLIETKNNYLFASNIKYQDNIYDTTYDARTYRFMYANQEAISNLADVVYPSVTVSAYNMITDIYDSHTNNYTTFTLDQLGSLTIDSKHDCINKYNDLNVNATEFYVNRSTSDYTKNKYAYSFLPFTYTVPGPDNQTLTITEYNIVYGGIGPNISWRFTVGELVEDTTPSPSGFVGSLSTSTVLYGSRGCLRGSNYLYDSTAGLFQGIWLYNVRYDGTLINKHFYKMQDTITQSTRNYSNPLIASKLISLQRDEVYRFGIIFYNKYGIKSQVNWIGDIRTPSAAESGFETFIANKKVSFLQDLSDLFTCGLATRPLGIEFKVTNLPSDAVGYEIVRCKRNTTDRATLSQGIISIIASRETTDETNSSTKITPQLSPSILPVSTFEYLCTLGNNNGLSGFGTLHYNTTGNSSYYNFYSPEISYDYDNYKTILNYNELSLYPFSYLFSANKQGNTPAPIHSNINSIHCYDKADPSSSDTIAESDFYEFSNTVADTKLDPCVAYLYTSRNSTLFPDYGKWAVTAKFYELTDRLYYNVSGSKIASTIWPLNDLTFPLEATWSDYTNRNSLISSLNGNIYNNWVRALYTSSNVTDDDVNTLQGPNGRSIAMSVTGNTSFLTNYVLACDNRKIVSPNSSSDNIFRFTHELDIPSTYTIYPESRAGVLLCNLRRPIVPYNGYDYNTRQYSTYYSTGCYNTDSVSFLPIFIGDTYICNFDCVKTHRYHYSNTTSNISTESTTWDNLLQHICVDFVVPVETTINLSYDLGPTYHRSNLQEIQLLVSDVNSLYQQTKPLYVYNTAYSVTSLVIPLTPLNDEDKYDRQIDTRTLYSNKKSADEMVDSWSIFQPANYLDVESRYGAITDLCLFNNDLIFWLRDATGHFSVLERSLLSSSEQEPLVLGSGEVLSRYDYLSTVNGMKELQRCDTQSENTLYWFDYDRNELCDYCTLYMSKIKSGNGVESLSRSKGVQNYINELKEKNTVLSLPSLSYNRYYDEMTATLESGHSLLYNEGLGIFTGRTSLTVNELTAKNNGDMFYIKDNLIYKTIYLNNLPIKILDSYEYPFIKYIVNTNYEFIKIFDNVELPLAYNNSYISDYTSLMFNFTTDSYTNMSCQLSGNNLSQREYSYRGAIPRYGNSTIGNRMRGRVLYCTLAYNTAAYGLDLPYVLTKFRISNS